LDALFSEAPAPTARAHARAVLLLERHGLVNREVAAGEVQAFGPLVPVLHALEDAGRVRRGWFVSGLSASTWAHAGAVDRLRALRFPPEVPEARVLAAVDPALVWGGALDWPEGAGAGARRAAGHRVVLVDGEPVLALARGARALTTFPACGDPRRLRAAVDALQRRLREEGARSTTFVKVDGGPARESPRAEALITAGLRPDGAGLRLELPL
jgi:ATP-dependent Lhr-like helicase